uniref:C-type lectin domain-containing protein n=1 Tax=Pundamilia nyererei TaxID=303518 RepID=A0A3B4GWM1_9CICH
GTVVKYLPTTVLSNSHYHFVNESLNWYEAQSFCRLKYNDLATIYNMNDENQLISTLGCNYKRWLWSDGSGRADFTKWSPGEPINSGGIESCGEMYANGFWNDAPCGVNKACGQTWPSSQNFCRQKHTDLACVHSEEGNVAINTLTYRVWMGLFKDSWVWSDGTKTSFSPGEPNNDGSKNYVYYTQGQTWSNSQDLCRQKHTDLACVHTEQENLATGAFFNSVWFGLFKDSWYWSDGTKTSFRYWQRGRSYSGNCVSVEQSVVLHQIRCHTNYFCHYKK